MSGSITLSLQGIVLGDAFGSQGVNPPGWFIPNTIQQQELLPLGSGDSAPWPIPAGAHAILLLPLDRGAKITVRRSDAAAPGWPINRGDFPTVLPLDQYDTSPPTALVFNAAAAARLLIKVL